MSLVGKRFGRWLVKELGEPYVSPGTGHKATRYICECTCNKIKLVRETSLLSGDSTSCGCLAKELVSNRFRTHGLSSHPLHSIWSGILKRCNNSNRKDFKHYGGRGIIVCERWSNSENGLHNFIEDMFPSFVDGLEIDRIDVNGNYCRENCKWATRQEQVINRRPTGSSFDTRFITYNDKTLCLAQWATEMGLCSSTLNDRINKLGWDIERAFTTPTKVKSIMVTIDCTIFTLKDIFQFPPNQYTMAKKLGKQMPQYCADLFFSTGDVTVIISKKVVNIKPVENLSNKLLNLNLKPEFINFMKCAGHFE